MRPSPPPRWGEGSKSLRSESPSPLVLSIPGILPPGEGFLFLEEKSSEALFGEGVVVLIYAPLEDNFGLPEVRLERRLAVLLEQFTAQPHCSIPQASASHNDMDAAYDFFANPRVAPADILTAC